MRRNLLVGGVESLSVVSVCLWKEEVEVSQVEESRYKLRSVLRGRESEGGVGVRVPRVSSAFV